MYRFCPRIVVSWHLRRPQTRFQTRFRTRSQTRFRTRFRFQHFPEPRRNLVSVFLVIFCFFPVFFSSFFLFFSVFSPVFPVFPLFFLVFRIKMMCLVSYCFPFLAENSPRMRIVSHFSPKTRLEFRIVSHFSPKTRLESPRFQKTGLVHP
jgi:hypothetical protein